MMCGGAEDDKTYTAPKTADVYKQYRDTGQIPYSYYGVGAPTREGEMDLVRRSYPNAFSQASGQPMGSSSDPMQKIRAILQQLNFDPNIFSQIPGGDKFRMGSGS
jgi:hypothetical protein